MDILILALKLELAQIYPQMADICQCGVIYCPKNQSMNKLTHTINKVTETNSVVDFVNHYHHSKSISGKHRNPMEHNEAIMRLYYSKKYLWSKILSETYCEF